MTPSNNLILCPPLLLTSLIFPSIIVVSSESHSLVTDSCNPMDCSLPGSSVHGILQARILEWIAISFSRGYFWPGNQTPVSCIAGRFFTDWAMREAPSIMVFSNESVLRIRWPKYWSSASILPMNTQDWSPLGWSGWISLLSKDSQESSPIPQFKSINSSVLSFLYSPTLTSIHDYWKNQSFEYMDLCW